MEILNDYYINIKDLVLDEFAVEDIIDAVTDYQNSKVKFNQLCGEINGIIQDYINRFIFKIELNDDELLSRILYKRM